MTLGLGRAEKPAGEIRVGFRAGWVRTVAISVGGAGVAGLLLGFLDLAQREPQQVFTLLQQWGFVWLLVLAALAMAWDLAKSGLGYLGKLADAVQDSAVAMNRIADKDDREHDRLTTEISYIGQRMERLSDAHKAAFEEQRDHHREVLALLAAKFTVPPEGK